MLLGYASNHETKIGVIATQSLQNIIIHSDKKKYFKIYGIQYQYT